MLGQAIANVQKLEKQMAGNTPEQLRARIAIRACLKELRGLATEAGDIDHDRSKIDGTVLPFMSRAPSLIPNQ